MTQPTVTQIQTANQSKAENQSYSTIADIDNVHVLTRQIQSEIRKYVDFQRNKIVFDTYANNTNMKNLLAYMGSPEKKLKIAHIAGSKGKGSTGMYLAQILSACGLNVGLYLSPFCFTLRDAIQVTKTPNIRQSHSTSPDIITQSNMTDSYMGMIDFATLKASYQVFQEMTKVMRQQKNAEPTHFESLTALAFDCFQRKQVDIAVVEVGLGGRYDSTNVFGPQQSILQVLTQIQYEHAHILGETIDKIAEHKAGIIQNGSEVLISKQMYDIPIKVFKTEAEQKGAKVQQVVEPSWVQLKGDPYILQQNQTNDSKLNSSDQDEQSNLQEKLLYYTLARQNLSLELPKNLSQGQQLEVKSKLIGSSQIWSVQGAIEAAQILQDTQKFQNYKIVKYRQWELGINSRDPTQDINMFLRKMKPFQITEQSIKNGIEAAYLPGRMQILQLTPPAQDNSDIQKGKPKYIIFDGSHTPDSCREFVANVHKVFPNNPIGLVVSVMFDKRVHEMMDEIVKINPRVAIFTEVQDYVENSKRSLTPGTLLANWQEAFQKYRRVQSQQNIQVNRVRAMIQANVYGSIEKVKSELTAHEGEGVICVIGSLYSANSSLMQLLQRGQLKI